MGSRDLVEARSRTTDLGRKTDGKAFGGLLEVGTDVGEISGLGFDLTAPSASQLWKVNKPLRTLATLDHP